MTAAVLALELPGMPHRPPPAPPPADPDTPEQRRALVLIAAHLAHRHGAGWAVTGGPTHLDPPPGTGWLAVNRQTLDALHRRGLISDGSPCELTAAGVAALDRLTVCNPLRRRGRAG